MELTFAVWIVDGCCIPCRTVPEVKMEQVEEKVENALHLDHPGHHHGGRTAQLSNDLHEPTEDSNTLDIRVHSSGALEEYEKDTAVNSDVPTERQSLDNDKNGGGGVNVLSAEKHFAELQRQLSQVSQTSRKLSRQQSRAKSTKNGMHEIGMHGNEKDCIKRMA